MSNTADNKVVDLRVDLILRVEAEHMCSLAASKSAPKGERWRCRCGVDFKGDGAIKKGRRHQAAEVIAALDEAGVTA